MAIELHAFDTPNGRKISVALEEMALPYTVKVVDLKDNPRLAREHNIVAIPTLVRKLPVPIQKIIGDLSDTEKVLVHLKMDTAA